MMVGFSFSKKPFVLALTISKVLINSLGANLNLVLQKKLIYNYNCRKHLGSMKI
jgi:hypothetical protein